MISLNWLCSYIIPSPPHFIGRNTVCAVFAVSVLYIMFKIRINTVKRDFISMYPLPIFWYTPIYGSLLFYYTRIICLFNQELFFPLPVLHVRRNIICLSVPIPSSPLFPFCKLIVKVRHRGGPAGGLLPRRGGLKKQKSAPTTPWGRSFFISSARTQDRCSRRDRPGAIPRSAVPDRRGAGRTSWPSPDRR